MTNKYSELYQNRKFDTSVWRIDGSSGQRIINRMGANFIYLEKATFVNRHNQYVEIFTNDLNTEEDTACLLEMIKTFGASSVTMNFFDTDANGHLFLMQSIKIKLV